MPEEFDVIGNEAVDVEKLKTDDRTGFQKFMCGWRAFWKWVFRLRSVELAIPIAVLAILLAIYNNATLPEEVGINLQSTGDYSQMITRSTAVYYPLGLTGICLLLLLCSRRVLFPWLISVFSLVLPVLILITNIFPS